MNREKLAIAMETASPIITQEDIDSAEDRVIDPAELYIGHAGTRNLVIVMEELAELQQQVSKYLRGKRDRLCLTEEVADVYLSLRYIETICKLSKDDINKAMNVKLDRLRATEGTYQ